MSLTGVELYLVTMAGSLALWIKSDSASRRIHGLSDVYALIVPENDRAQKLLTFATFLIFGSIVGMILVAPDTISQAFVGGIGWSYLISTDKKHEEAL